MTTRGSLAADSSPAKLVMTVLGPVPADDLGVVLPHEHLLVKLHVPQDLRSDRFNERVRLSNLGWVRQHWASSADNTTLSSERTALSELARLKVAGGGTLVDLTLPGMGRRRLALQRMSTASGTHIVMGCGAYVEETHPEWIAAATTEEVAAIFVDEATVGIGATGVRAGIIGEIGCSWPLAEAERKVLVASAKAQAATGLAISVHPGRHRDAPLQIIDILGSAGADISRVAIGHLDRTIQDAPGLFGLARTGCYLELDLFGLETSFYPWPGVAEGLSDAQRLYLVRELIDHGYGRQALISHDICTKHRLSRYGGHGYDHLLSNVTPWMRARGFSDGELAMILRTNPATFLGH